MPTTKTFFTASVLVPLLLLSSACTTSQITQFVDVAQIGVSGLVTDLAITGKIPPPLVPVVTAYAQTATATLGSIIIELGSGDSSAQKTAKCVGYLAAATLSYQHLSPEAKLLVSLVNSDLQAIASLFGATVPTSTGALASHTGTVLVPAHVKLSFGDKAKLKDILARNAADQLKLASRQAIWGN